MDSPPPPVSLVDHILCALFSCLGWALALPTDNSASTPDKGRKSCHVASHDLSWYSLRVMLWLPIQSPVCQELPSAFSFCRGSLDIRRIFPTQPTRSLLRQKALCSECQTANWMLSAKDPCLDSAWDWHMIRVPVMIGWNLHCVHRETQTLPGTNFNLIKFQLCHLRWLKLPGLYPSHPWKEHTLKVPPHSGDYLLGVVRSPSMVWGGLMAYVD